MTFVHPIPTADGSLPSDGAAGVDAAAGPDARADAGLGCGGPAQPLPDGAPPNGWSPFPLFGGSCVLYTPTSKAQLPDPIQWESCSGVLPSSVACRQMTLGWPSPPAGSCRVDLTASGWVRPDGTLVLQLSRRTGDIVYRMVADADGPVHSAIVEPSGAGCTLGSYQSLNEGNVAYTSYQAGQPERSGCVAGNIDDLVPRVYRSFADGIQRDYFAGAMGLVELPPISVLSWSDGGTSAKLSFAGSDASLQPGEFQLSGNAMFFSLTSQAYARIKVFTPSAGLTDLLTAGDDLTKGFADLGTDGHDLVWMEGSGRSSAGSTYPTKTWMTSPFVTAAAGLQPKKLRSETRSLFGVAPFVVGCGFAAQYALGNATDTLEGIRVVRLADGWSWPLMTRNGTDPWQWVTPIAVTCTEVFVTTVLPSGEHDIARVKLDSLGAGDAPN